MGRKGTKFIYEGIGFMVEEMTLRQRFQSVCSEST